MTWVACGAEATGDSDVELKFEDESDEVKEFSAQLQQLLYDRTQGEAWESERRGIANGLEPFRRIKRRFLPRSVGSQRALLKQLLCLRPASKLDEVEARICHLKDLSCRYAGMYGKTLEEYLRATLLVDVCLKDLRSRTRAWTMATPTRIPRI